MPQIAPLTLKDSTLPTAVDRVYDPLRQVGTKAQWADTSSSTLAGRSILTVETKSPSSKLAAHRTHVTLGLPHEVTFEGKTSVEYVDSVDITINRSQISQDKNGSDILALVASLFGDASFKAAVVKQTSYW